MSGNVRRDLAWQVVAQVLVQAFAFAVSIFFFRQLEETLYGLYQSVFMVMGTLAIFLFFEPSQVLVKRLAETPLEDRVGPAHEGFCLALGFAALYSLVFVAGGELLASSLVRVADDPAGRDFLSAVGLAAFLPLASVPSLWAQNVLQGTDRMDRAAILLVLQNAARPLGALAGFLWTGTLADMLAGVLAATALTSAYAWREAGRAVPGLTRAILRRPWCRPEGGFFRRVVVLSVDKKFTDQFELLPRQVLTYMFPPQSSPFVAWFDVLGKLLLLVNNGVVTPLARVILPKLARIRAEGGWKALRDTVRTVIVKGAGAGLVVAVVAAAGSWFVAFPHFYRFDPDEAVSIGKAGAWLLLLLPFLGIGAVNAPLVLILDKLGAALKYKIALAIPFGLAAWWLIGNHGLTGACLYVVSYRLVLRLGLGAWLWSLLDRRVQADTAS